MKTLLFLIFIVSTVFSYGEKALILQVDSASLSDSWKDLNYTVPGKWMVYVPTIQFRLKVGYFMPRPHCRTVVSNFIIKKKNSGRIGYETSDTAWRGWSTMEFRRSITQFIVDTPCVYGISGAAEDTNIKRYSSKDTNILLYRIEFVNKDSFMLGGRMTPSVYGTAKIVARVNIIFYDSIMNGFDSAKWITDTIMTAPFYGSEQNGDQVYYKYKPPVTKVELRAPSLVINSVPKFWYSIAGKKVTANDVRQLSTGIWFCRNKKILVMH